MLKSKRLIKQNNKNVKMREEKKGGHNNNQFVNLHVLRLADLKA